MIDSVFRTGKNCYPQVFLEECKYVFKEKKIPKYIIDDIEFSSDTDRENSEEEFSHEGKYKKKNLIYKTLMNGNLMKKINKYFFIIFLIYIKLVNKHYQKHKKSIRKQAHENIFQHLSEEEKGKR